MWPVEACNNIYVDVIVVISHHIRDFYCSILVDIQQPLVEIYIACYLHAAIARRSSKSNESDFTGRMGTVRMQGKLIRKDKSRSGRDSNDSLQVKISSGGREHQCILGGDNKLARLQRQRSLSSCI